MTPTPVTLGDAITALTDIGVFATISIAAVLALAVLVYKRFRK